MSALSLPEQMKRLEQMKRNTLSDQNREDILLAIQIPVALFTLAVLFFLSSRAVQLLPVDRYQRLFRV